MNQQSPKAEPSSDSRKDSFWRRARVHIWGYDFFISHAWSDGRLYAERLAKELDGRLAKELEELKGRLAKELEGGGGQYTEALAKELDGRLAKALEKLDGHLAKELKGRLAKALENGGGQYMEALAKELDGRLAKELAKKLEGHLFKALEGDCRQYTEALAKELDGRLAKELEKLNESLAKELEELKGRLAKVLEGGGRQYTEALAQESEELDGRLAKRLEELKGRLTKELKERLAKALENGGGQYMEALDKELKLKQERKEFICFVDDKEFLMGEDHTKAGRRALKKTRYLILVGSPGAMGSEAVQREIHEFLILEKKDGIIPIEFDEKSVEKWSKAEAWSEQPWGKNNERVLPRRFDNHVLRINEGDSRRPSDATIEGILTAAKGRTVRERTRRGLLQAAGLLILLVISIIGVSFLSYQRRTRNLVDGLFVLSDQASPSTGAREASKVEFANERSQYEEALTKLRYRWRSTQAILGMQAEIREEDNSTLSAKKRADAAITLLHLDDSDSALEYLSTSEQDDPETLAQFAARCRLLRGLPPERLLEFINFTHEQAAMSSETQANLPFYAALIALGEYNVPESFKPTLREWFRDHPSAAIHSACGWLLGREDVVKEHAKFAQQPEKVSLNAPKEGDKEWFVVKLQPDAGDEADQRVDYITFVIFEDQQKRVFAVANRETTVGVCDQLGKSGLYDVYDEKYQKVDPTDVHLDPANKVTFEDAKWICEKLSTRFKTLRTHLPNHSEWASAWGNPNEDEQRVFQFGRDEDVLKRYAKFGLLLTRPDQVATHRPSMTGMFDMHGNVAEWTIEGKMRGGAVGQPAEYCKWIPPSERGGTHKGFRFCLSRDD